MLPLLVPLIPMLSSTAPIAGRVILSYGFATLLSRVIARVKHGTGVEVIANLPAPSVNSYVEQADSMLRAIQSEFAQDRERRLLEAFARGMQHLHDVAHAMPANKPYYAQSARVDLTSVVHDTAFLAGSRVGSMAVSQLKAAAWMGIAATHILVGEQINFAKCVDKAAEVDAPTHRLFLGPNLTSELLRRAELFDDVKRRGLLIASSAVFREVSFDEVVGLRIVQEQLWSFSDGFSHKSMDLVSRCVGVYDMLQSSALANDYETVGGALECLSADATPRVDNANEAEDVIPIVALHWPMVAMTNVFCNIAQESERLSLLEAVYPILEFCADRFDMAGRRHTGASEVYNNLALVCCGRATLSSDSSASMLSRALGLLEDASTSASTAAAPAIAHNLSTLKSWRSY